MLTKAHLLRHGFDDRRANFPRQPVPVCNKILTCHVGAGQVQTRRTTATAPTIEVLPDRHGYRYAVNLGTKWEHCWGYQPNATTISEEQVSIVTGLKTKTLSIAATCFQYHEYGRLPGLKIRSSLRTTYGRDRGRIREDLARASPMLVRICLLGDFYAPRGGATIPSLATWRPEVGE